MYKIRIMFSHPQKLPINAHADICGGARGVNFGESLHLYPCLVYASSDGSGEPVHLHRLA